MANRRLSIVAGVAGISAGLTPYLPTLVCPGVACTSCFACIGAGGAAASALLLGLLGGRIRNRETGEAAPSSTGSEKGGATVG